MFTARSPQVLLITASSRWPDSCVNSATGVNGSEFWPLKYQVLNNEIWAGET